MRGEEIQGFEVLARDPEAKLIYLPPMETSISADRNP